MVRTVFRLGGAFFLDTSYAGLSRFDFRAQSVAGKISVTFLFEPL